MKIAMITDEVSQDLDFLLDFAAAHEVRGFELRSLGNEAIDQLSPAEAREIRRRLDEHGITVVGLASSFGKTLFTPENLRGEERKLERLLELAAIFGAPYIRAFAFLAPEGAEHSEVIADEDAIAAFFQKQRSKLEEAGVRLLLEADPSVNTPTHKKLARLLAAIDQRELIGAIYDPGNCLFAPEAEEPFPEAWEAIASSFGHVHIKDAIGRGSEAEAVKVGTGEVPWARILTVLEEHGYDGWLSMETHYRLARQLTEEEMQRPGGAAFSDGGDLATAESIESLRQVARGLL